MEARKIAMQTSGVRFCFFQLPSQNIYLSPPNKTKQEAWRDPNREKAVVNKRARRKGSGGQKLWWGEDDHLPAARETTREERPKRSVSGSFCHRASPPHTHAPAGNQVRTTSSTWGGHCLFQAMTPPLPLPFPGAAPNSTKFLGERLRPFPCLGGFFLWREATTSKPRRPSSGTCCCGTSPFFLLLRPPAKPAGAAHASPLPCSLPAVLLPPGHSLPQ